MTRGNPSSSSHSVEIRDKEIRAGGGFSSGGEARVCVIRVSLFFLLSFFLFLLLLFLSLPVVSYRRSGCRGEQKPSQCVNSRGSETLEWNECPGAYKISNLASGRPNLTRARRSFAFNASYLNTGAPCKNAAISL